MIAAIEIYNKPQIQYRDKCFVILLLNAWELFVKALLSKNQRSIYYPKKRRQPYRTLSISDALQKCQDLIPSDIGYVPVSQNIELVNTYRDNAIHFYNKKDFGVIVYALAQTSIVNYRDLMYTCFGLDLADEISVRLLPLGINSPLDPIEFMKNPADSKGRISPAIAQFIIELTRATDLVEQAGADTGRLLTIFNIKLESMKKIAKSDFMAGIVGAVGSGDYIEEPLVVEKRMDPNVTHPLRQKDIAPSRGHGAAVADLHGISLTPYVFQAIAWKFDLKTNPHYCWISDDKALTKYSRDVIPFLKRLSQQEVMDAIQEYRAWLQERRRSRKTA